MFEQKIMIHGLPRSGHHAFVNWVATGIEGRLAYLNCLSPGDWPRTLRQYNRLPSVRLEDLRKAQNLLVSVESAKLWDLDNKVVNEKIESSITNHVIFIREPHNNLASYLQGRRNRGRPHLRKTALWAREHWVHLAREALRETFYLPSVLMIRFEDWLVKSDVRDRVKGYLTIHPDDAAIRVKSKIGGGSSFHNRISSTDELKSRWEAFRGDEEYLNLFRCEELSRLGKLLYSDEFTRIKNNVQSRNVG